MNQDKFVEWIRDEITKARARAAEYGKHGGTDSHYRAERYIGEIVALERVLIYIQMANILEKS